MRGHISSDQVNKHFDKISCKMFNYNGIILAEINTSLTFKKFSNTFEITDNRSNRLLMYCNKEGLFLPLAPFRNIKENIPKLNLYDFNQAVSLTPGNGKMTLKDIKLNIINEWVYFKGATEKSKQLRGNFMMIPLEEMFYHPIVLLYSYFLNSRPFIRNPYLSELIKNVGDECFLDLNKILERQPCCWFRKFNILTDLNYPYMEGYEPYFQKDKWKISITNDGIYLNIDDEYFKLEYDKIKNICNVSVLKDCNLTFTSIIIKPAIRYVILNKLYSSKIKCSYFKSLFEFPIE